MCCTEECHFFRVKLSLKWPSLGPHWSGGLSADVQHLGEALGPHSLHSCCYVTQETLYCWAAITAPKATCRLNWAEGLWQPRKHLMEGIKPRPVLQHRQVITGHSGVFFPFSFFFVLFFSFSFSCFLFVWLVFCWLFIVSVCVSFVVIVVVLFYGVVQGPAPFQELTLH